MLTQGVEWALHTCALLALVPRGRALPAAKLAEFHALPAAYLAKQLQQLSAAGIVEAVRGKAGGYRLARPVREITFLDVVDAVEGRKPLFRCIEIRQRGPTSVEPSSYHGLCAIATTMAEAEQAWRAVLASRTLSEILTTMKVPPKQVQRSAAWFREALDAPARIARAARPRGQQKEEP